MTPNPTVAKFAPVRCNTCNQPILAGESTYEGEKCHDSASDCVRKTREAAARWCAEMTALRKALKRHQQAKNARVCCAHCEQLMSTKYRELCSPGDPTAKVKCDKCGAWSTMLELNMVSHQKLDDELTGGKVN